MKDRDKQAKNRVCIFSFILGIFTFILIYGIRVLNPTYVDWLLNGRDLMQHYLGWEFYRKSSWYFPIGLTNQLGYPALTSVVFTDSIPILAVPFKLFAPILPQKFQYFGWWGIVSFGLQGYVAAKILRLYVKEEWKILVGSLFFIVSPIMIFRMYMHTALAAHWLVLMSIYLCAKHDSDYVMVKKVTLQWGLIGFFVAGIHLYFAPMCAALLAGYILYSCILDKKISLRNISPMISFAIGLFGNTYLLGGFSSRAASVSNPLGVHSFNLNSFFNSMGYSRVIPALPHNTLGQYEGFAYLGLGGLILLIITGIYTLIRLMKKQTKINAWKIGVVFVVSVGLVVLAASPFISYGDKLLLELPDIDIIIEYWSIFASSGRLVWPVYYMIMLFAVITIMKMGNLDHWKGKVSTGVLVLCIVLQIFDFSGKLTSIHNDYATEITYESPYTDGIWKKIAQQGYQHLVWVSHNTNGNDILHMAAVAFENQMSINNYYFARGIDFREYTRQEMQELNEETLYVFVPEDTMEYEDYTLYTEQLYFYEADGYILGSVKPIE